MLFNIEARYVLFEAIRAGALRGPSALRLAPRQRVCRAAAAPASSSAAGCSAYCSMESAGIGLGLSGGISHKAKNQLMVKGAAGGD